MTDKQQIEELAKFVCNACEFGGGFKGHCCIDNDYRKCGLAIETAKAIFKADYRKTERKHQ